jgi:creatinine amidohydrolase
MLYEELTTSELEKMLDERSVAILPLGAMEEHGCHLPLSTDCLQPEFVAMEVAKKVGNAFVLPIVKYGQCSSTRNFPGTLSLRFETLEMLIEDIVSELARTGFRNVVVLSGHAGRVHMAALRTACERALEKDDIKIMVLSDYDIAYKIKDLDIPENDGHAGMIETSRVMAIRPDLVRKGAKAEHPDFPEFRVLRHPERHFPGGVMGDPTKASKEKGQVLNNIIIEKLAELIKKMVESEE